MLTSKQIQKVARLLEQTDRHSSMAMYSRTPPELFYPRVEFETGPQVEVQKLLGSWTRDKPLDVRTQVCTDLRMGPLVPALLDLSDIEVMDDWGAGIICDALHESMFQHSKAAWVGASSRKDDYAILRDTLEHRAMEVPEFEDLQTAVNALTL